MLSYMYKSQYTPPQAGKDRKYLALKTDYITLKDKYDKVSAFNIQTRYHYRIALIYLTTF